MVAGEACAPDLPATGGRSVAIVNGTFLPEAVALGEAQIRSIGWLYAADAPSFPYCSATLIAPDLVATAAHCVSGVAPGDIGFGVGPDADLPEGLFHSAGIFPNREVDAALILLAEDVTASGLFVAPIPVNQTPLDDSLVGRALQVGGYGETLLDDTDARQFATVYVSEVGATEVVVDGHGVQGLCFGDSGSGLVDVDADGRPVVLAVESNGDDTCVDLDRMARLDTIWDWIEPALEGETPPDPCLEIGAEGSCEGDVEVSCPAGSLRRTDCTIWGEACGWIEEAGQYGCPCGDVPDTGWCNRDMMEFCHRGQLSQTNCAARGQRCGYVLGEGRYTCTGLPICLNEDEAGRCVGDVAVNCLGGSTTRELCYIDGQVCVATADGAICAEPGPDGPDAGAADAGPDADAGVDGEGGADPGRDAGSHDGADGGGCSCRAGAPRTRDGSLFILLSALLAISRRPRSR